MLNKLNLLFLSGLLFSGLLFSFIGCSSLSPYKMEIRQGNYITPEMRKKIKVGMSRQQITGVLGSPLVSDVFHANRWDYIYTYEEKSKLVERQYLTLFFEGDFVKRIEDNPAEGSVPVAPASK